LAEVDALKHIADESGSKFDKVSLKAIEN